MTRVILYFCIDSSCTLVKMISESKEIKYTIIRFKLYELLLTVFDRTFTNERLLRISLWNRSDLKRELFSYKERKSLNHRIQCFRNINDTWDSLKALLKDRFRFVLKCVLVKFSYTVFSSFSIWAPPVSLFFSWEYRPASFREQMVPHLSHECCY